MDGSSIIQETMIAMVAFNTDEDQDIQSAEPSWFKRITKYYFAILFISIFVGIKTLLVCYPIK